MEVITMKHIAIIYDKEKYYAEKLSEYFNASDIFPFETRALFDKQQVIDFCNENEVEVVIMDECVYGSNTPKYSKNEIVLTTNHLITSPDIYQIYKYQEAEIIIKQVIMYLSESSEIGFLLTRKKEMKIISFYSPVKRSLSTTMSIGMGQILGKRHKTLYVNLESFSGLSKLIGREFYKDINDLLYYMESKSGNIGMVLTGIVEQLEGVDILPPAKSQNDIIAVNFDQWKEMLKRIEQDTDYEYVILDLSEAVQGLLDLMEMSDCT